MTKTKFDILYDRFFSYYISNKRYEKLVLKNKYKVLQLSTFLNNRTELKRIMKKYKNIITGYISTSVRGYHNYYIFYR